METSRYDPPAEPMTALCGLSIMIVDDSAACRQVQRRMTERLGMTVRCVETAMEAVKTAGLRRFDFIMLDIGLEDADGRALAAAFRASPMTRYSVIVCVSGLGGADRAAASIKAGADLFIQKPLPAIAELNRALTNIYNRRRQAGFSQDVLQVEPIDAEDILGEPAVEASHEIAAFASEDLSRAYQRLEWGLSHDDFAAVHRATHFLSGVAGLIGAVELEQHCVSARQSAQRTLNPADVQTLLKLTKAAQAQLAVGASEPPFVGRQRS